MALIQQKAEEEEQRLKKQVQELQAALEAGKKGSGPELNVDVNVKSEKKIEEL